VNGKVDVSLAGLFASLVRDAAKLAPKDVSEDAPTILIETDKRLYHPHTYSTINHIIISTVLM
jgi:hypothetical protein